MLGVAEHLVVVAGRHVLPVAERQEHHLVQLLVVGQVQREAAAAVLRLPSGTAARHPLGLVVLRPVAPAVQGLRDFPAARAAAAGSG
ncbi:hypothetical protein LUR56_41050 [Streptomyces sp. MT29]|nr:hypothetical protein [Streptomyces sp. MT29]